MIRKQSETRPERAGARSFRFTISSGSVDRDRDTIDPSGWDLAAYRRAPTILWAHDYRQLPIARTTSIGVEGGALKATAEFPEDGIYPFADQVRRLLDAGYISSASVGFRPLEHVFNAQRGGTDFKRQELLEWSIVNVGSLPTALVERRDVGVDRAAVRKWLGVEHLPVVGRSRGSDVVIELEDEDDLDISRLTPADVRGAFREVISDIVAREWKLQTAHLLGPAETILVLDDEDVTGHLSAGDVRDAFRAALGPTVAGLVSQAIDALRGKIID